MSGALLPIPGRRGRDRVGADGVGHRRVRLGGARDLDLADREVAAEGEEAAAADEVAGAGGAGEGEGQAGRGREVDPADAGEDWSGEGGGGGRPHGRAGGRAARG